MYRLLREYFWIYRIPKHIFPLFILIFILQVLHDICTAIFPLLFALMIDGTFIQHDLRLLSKYLALYTLLFFISLLLATVIEKCNLRVKKDFTYCLQTITFRKMLMLPADQLYRLNTGDTSFVINTNVNDIYDFLNSIIFPVTATYIYLIVIIFLMGHISWKVTIAIILLSVLTIFFSDIYKQKFTSLRKSYRKMVGEQIGWLLEVLTGIKDVRANNGEEFIAKKYSAMVQDLLHRKEQLRFVEIKAERLTGFFNALFTIAFWIVSAVLIVLGDITLGCFFALEKYFNLLIQKLELIKDAKVNYHSFRPNFEKVAELLQLPLEDLSNGQNITLKDRQINLSHVCYQYLPNTAVLNDINASIKYGSFVALVGGNGTGKSTLLALLERFLIPCSGDIFFDTYSIQDISLFYLRNQIGYIQQDTIIFEGTLRDNLTLYAPTATTEEIWDALDKVGLSQFVHKWDKGLETDLLKGTRLSGGQKQRLAFARILLKKASVILMDEPTAFMDEEIEGTLMKEIKTLFPDKTIIVVSHRRNTVKQADHIIILKDGSILATGPDRLLKGNCNEYTQLFYE